MNVRIGSHDIGDGQPAYVIGEIGLNHTVRSTWPRS